MNQEIKQQIDTMIKNLRKQTGLHVSCDYKVKEFDGMEHNALHVVLRASVYRKAPQNFISFMLNKPEIRVLIPHVESKEEFAKKYGFPLNGIIPQGYGSTADRVWVMIDRKYFIPLLTDKGDTTLICNLFKSVSPNRAPAQTITNQEMEALGENITLDDPLPEAIEGKLKVQYKLHRQRERDPKIIRLKKAAALESDPLLRCEACQLSMHEMYGEPGKYFCEVHHRTPLWCLDDSETVETSLEDLAILCPNCHSIIHRDRKNPTTVDSLKDQIKRLR